MKRVAQMMSLQISKQQGLRRKKAREARIKKKVIKHSLTYLNSIKQIILTANSHFTHFYFCLGKKGKKD